MKVLILNTLFPPHRIGGAEKSVALLADGLARAGEIVRVATLDDIRDARQEHLPNGIVVHRLPLDNIYWPYGDVDAARPRWQRLAWHLRNRWNRRMAARVGVLIDQERPDVVHCNVLTGFSVAVWAEIEKRGLPIVQTLRDYAVICTRAGLFNNGRQCARRCAECTLLTSAGRRMSRKVAQLVSNSDYVIEAHRRFGYFEAVPARRIFNIVPLSARPVEARHGDGALVFGFIGRVEAEKGIEVVLAACVRMDRAEWRLRIAGVGAAGYVAQLRQRYPDPRIEWLGYCEADSFYRSIDVVLIASVWPEPLPRTLIEALSYGLSAICSSAGGISEIADLARLSISYAATDAGALAAAMACAIDGKREWRERGFRSVDALAPFTEQTVVAQYRQVYLDAISSTRRAR
jgi:glycosyltransferase involved in cell wall biosynthesis